MTETTDILTSTLTLAIAQTIENMTFEEVDDEMEEIDNYYHAEEMCWSILPILKPVNGKLALVVSNECAKLLINNVYDEIQEEEISDNAINDMLSEIINTIGGRFMDSVLASDQEFELGIPTAGRGPLPEHNNIIISKSTSVGQNIVTVTLSGDGFIKLKT